MYIYFCMEHIFTFEGSLMKAMTSWDTHGAINVPKINFIITLKGEDNDEPPRKKMKINESHDYEEYIELEEYKKEEYKKEVHKKD